MQIVISRDLYKTIQVEYVWEHSFYMEDLVLDVKSCHIPHIKKSASPGFGNYWTLLDKIIVPIFSINNDLIC